jgi:hypothetical protein
MQSIATRAVRNLDQLVDKEITLSRWRWSDRVSLICKAHMQGFAIRLTEYDDRANAQFATRTQDAHRDLSAICDQNFLEHGAMRRSGILSRAS